MTVSTPPREVATLASIRKVLLGALALGIVGTGGELILLRHIDSSTQWIPIALLAASVPTCLWHAAAPGPWSVRTVHLVMAAFIASGVLGIGLHYRGNVEFERELHPDARGLGLVRNAVTGATPVLAPGAMVLIGLVGLAHAYRHPSGFRAAGKWRER